MTRPYGTGRPRSNRGRPARRTTYLEHTTVKHLAITALHSLLTGAIAAAAVHALWYAATGYPAPALTALVLGQAGISVCAIAQAARFRRQWAGVMASYRLPAFGAGIDVPGRPPTDDAGEHGRKER